MGSESTHQAQPAQGPSAASFSTRSFPRGPGVSSRLVNYDMSIFGSSSTCSMVQSISNLLSRGFFLPVPRPLSRLHPVSFSQFCHRSAHFTQPLGLHVQRFEGQQGPRSRTRTSLLQTAPFPASPLSVSWLHPHLPQPIPFYSFL